MRVSAVCCIKYSGHFIQFCVRSIMADAEQKGGEEGGEVTGETLRKLQEQYLRNLKLQGVEGIRKAFIRQVRHCERLV